jgi:septal ring factor EnvC (AmiA/AmiB activator)
MDSFLMKNNTNEKLKKAIIERENYYRKVTNSASYSFKENKHLKCQVNELKNQISKIKTKLDKAVNSESSSEKDNKRYSDENQKLRDIINTYVYPEIANQLLKENGLIKNNSDIVDSEIIKKEIFSSESDVNKIKNKVIKGLFDSI